MVYYQLKRETVNKTLSNLQDFIYNDVDSVLLLVTVECDRPSEDNYYRKALLLSKSNATEECRDKRYKSFT